MLNRLATSIVRPRQGVGTRLTGGSAVIVWFMVLATGLAPPGVGTLPLHASPMPQEARFTRGGPGLGLLLRRLDGAKRVLVVGAHPDDEDTSLLAALSRGAGVETAYLSLTRGEGGQNLLGEEMGEGLGVVRTGELLAARELDGGLQFFGRAFDFGYSKSAGETLEHWPREEILADVTWVIRTFRPHVVVSIFSPTAARGHGHHQVAGMMALEAYRAAPDPDRFPEQLRRGAVPWAPSKLYRLTRSEPEGDGIEVGTGDFDYLLGRSHYQLAMEARSQHRSQDMGRLEPLGPRVSSLALVATRVEGSGADRGIFFGIDTTLAGLTADLPPETAGPVRRALDTYRKAVARAKSEMDALAPWKVSPHLARALSALRDVREALGDASRGAAELRRVLPRRLSRVEEALLTARGVVVDVRVERDLLVPGEGAEGVVEVWNGGPAPLRNVRASLEIPEGWRLERAEEGGEDAGTLPLLEPGNLARWRFSVEVPEDAELSRLYYLERPRRDDLYRWPAEPELWALPRDPAPVRGRVSLEIAEDGETLALALRREAEYRGLDKARGEYREPVLVVPAVSLRLEPASMIWPLGSREARDISVFLRNEGRERWEGRVELELPRGWTAEPSSIALAMEGNGSAATGTFRVSPPREVEEGLHRIGAVALGRGGETFREGASIIDYPHIARAALFREAGTRISVFPVDLPEGLTMGYVMGSGDAGPEAIRQMGGEVELLGPEDVRSGAFGGFDVVVLGIRAYETRSDLVAANEQLLDWVRTGGTLIVQYNKYEFPAGDFAPYPLDIRRPHDRVTDPDAPVTLLEPHHPVFHTPNRITDADFEGWVQERGLYFLGEWDRRYEPLLAMADPGEDPKRGALLVAPLGEGTYVYTGLAFFRQLPAGVAGAYRLFANLLALGVGEETR